uniref:Uncharacterized protein n=1 Tax=Anguilla anguilla TaxID=7936 RepID=A0A0E9TV96_ANGAN
MMKSRAPQRAQRWRRNSWHREWHLPAHGITASFRSRFL